MKHVRIPCLCIRLLAVCRLGAQPFILTSFVYPDGCSNTWTQVQGFVQLPCPGPPACSTVVMADYHWRYGCQEVADIKILG